MALRNKNKNDLKLLSKEEEEEEEEDNIIEVREDIMLSSPTAAYTHPTLRTAHFLKPISKELTLNDLNLNPSSSSSSSSTSGFESKERSLKIRFNGWFYPCLKWVKWVNQLKLRYESLWKKAGIFDAIMSTKSRIMKNQDLVYGVVDKWCCDTNTFVFPFAEATITLEDVKVLGGYSLFGHPVFTPLEDEEMKEVEKKLIDIEREERVIESMAPSISVWMDIFIDKGSEIEHEAFLATWLSIFVFPHKYYVVKSSFFPIAIHLARGNTIALGPTVLASLYKDLSLFKKQIVDLKKCPAKFSLVLDVNLQSPFYLVQVWVWERFKNLQPQPKLINSQDHVLLRWHKVQPLKIDNVRLALDSAIDDFIWRPYATCAHKCGMFYPNDEIIVQYKKDLDEEMLSFVACLRFSELVGFESIEKYLPHRVAMQFGMDQDIPSYVPRFNETKVIAWKNHCRRISDKNLYFPSRFFEAGVTTRYAKWWKKSVLGPQGFIKNVVPWKRSTRSLKCRPHARIPKLVGCGTVTSEKSSDDGSKINKGHHIADDVPSDFVPKLVGCTVTVGKSSDDGSKTSKGCNIVDDDAPSIQDGMEAVGNIVDDDDYVPSGSIPNVLKTISSENSVEDGLIAEKDVDPDAPSLLPKDDIMTPLISVEDCEHVLEDVEFKDDVNESIEARLSSDTIGQPETQTESYSYLFEVCVAELEQRICRLEKVHRKLKIQRLLQRSNQTEIDFKGTGNFL